MLIKCYCQFIYLLIFLRLEKFGDFYYLAYIIIQEWESNSNFFLNSNIVFTVTAVTSLKSLELLICSFSRKDFYMKSFSYLVIKFLCKPPLLYFKF